MTLELRESMDDWYVLDGGRNWACVEGTAEEWRAIARAMRERRGEGFRRCCVVFAPDYDGAQFYSPRNAMSAADGVRVPMAEVDALARAILDALGFEVVAIDCVVADTGEG